MKKIALSIMLAMSTLASSNISTKSLLHKIPSINNVIDYKSNVSCPTCYFPNEFTVTAWNMYKGKNESWESDFDALLAESDILLGQEFILKDVMKDRLQTPVDEDIVLATSFVSFKKYKTGVTNISKFATSLITPLRSDVKEPFIGTPKMVLSTQYELEDGRPITFINIHAINFVAKRKLKKQLKQVMKHINSTTGPVVFAGDFNTNSKKKIRMMRELLTSIGFQEAVFIGRDDRMKWLGNKLDYIWYRGLELIEARVRGEVQGADHKPLQATFKVINE